MFLQKGSGNSSFSIASYAYIESLGSAFCIFFCGVGASLIAIFPCRNKMFTIVSCDVANEILLLIFESYRSNEECDGCKIELAEVCGKCRQRYVMELN